MNKIRLVMLATLFVMLNYETKATTPAQRPTLESLSGNWLGSCAGGSGVCIRLQLNSSGKGLLAARLSWANTSIYEVMSTKVEDFAVSFALKPIGNARAATTQGIAGVNGMELHFQLDSWQQPFTSGVVKEEEVMRAIEALKGAASQYDLLSK
jgi:hypothetical protein